jgi:hypothetical protein
MELVLVLLRRLTMTVAFRLSSYEEYAFKVSYGRLPMRMSTSRATFSKRDSATLKMARTDSRTWQQTGGWAWLGYSLAVVNRELTLQAKEEAAD